MRTIEDLSGRRGLLPVYYRWRRDVAGKSPRMMGELLDMVGARIELNAPAWPPTLPARRPPYGGRLPRAPSAAAAFRSR